MMDLTLDDWANVAEIVSASSIVGAVIFAVIQIRIYRAQQRDVIALNLSQTFYSKDLAQALAILQELPDDIGLVEMRELGSEYVEAAMTVTTTFESMGLLVYKGVAPMDLVQDLAGGIISVMCRKLARWQEDMRIEQDQPSWGEWFDWLGQNASREKSSATPPTNPGGAS